MAAALLFTSVFFVRPSAALLAPAVLTRADNNVLGPRGAPSSLSCARTRADDRSAVGELTRRAGRALTRPVRADYMNPIDLCNKLNQARALCVPCAAS